MLPLRQKREHSKFLTKPHDPIREKQFPGFPVMH